MDLRLLVTPGKVTHFPDRCLKSVLADVCLIDLLGLDSSKADGGPVACQALLFPFSLYSSGFVIIPGKDFSGCPKVPLKRLLLF